MTEPTVSVTPTGVLADILARIKDGTDSGWWASSPLLTGVYVAGELTERGIGLVPFDDLDAIEEAERTRIRAAVQTIAIRTGNTYMQEWDGALVEVVKLADVLSAIELPA